MCGGDERERPDGDDDILGSSVITAHWDSLETTSTSLACGVLSLRDANSNGLRTGGAPGSPAASRAADRPGDPLGTNFGAMDFDAQRSAGTKRMGTADREARALGVAFEQGDRRVGVVAPGVMSPEAGGVDLRVVLSRARADADVAPPRSAGAREAEAALAMARSLDGWKRVAAREAENMFRKVLAAREANSTPADRGLRALSEGLDAALSRLGDAAAGVLEGLSSTGLAMLGIVPTGTVALFGLPIDWVGGVQRVEDFARRVGQWGSEAADAVRAGLAGGLSQVATSVADAVDGSADFRTFVDRAGRFASALPSLHKLADEMDSLIADTASAARREGYHTLANWIEGGGEVLSFFGHYAAALSPFEGYETGRRMIEHVADTFGKMYTKLREEDDWAKVPAVLGAGVFALADLIGARHVAEAIVQEDMLSGEDLSTVSLGA